MPGDVVQVEVEVRREGGVSDAKRLRALEAEGTLDKPILIKSLKSLCKDSFRERIF